MQQLITIETVPISIKYVANGPSLVTDKAASPKAPAKDAPAGKTTPQPARTDSFERLNPTGPYNLTYIATPRYFAKGSMGLDIEMRNTGSDYEVGAHVFQQFGKSIQNMMRQFFADKQSAANDMKDMQQILDFSMMPPNTAPGSGNTGKTFTPPDIEVEILEMPKVIVKYVGGPIYIPRSADPDYEAPEEINVRV